MKPKETKIQEAEDRHDRYAAMTPEQKIVRLNKGKYRAKRERERLGFPEIPEGCVN